MRTADFDYHLPPERIAQEPAPCREASRLLVLRRPSGTLEHRIFRDLPDLLKPDDLLVVNNSRVVPARLRAVKTGSGGRLEVLLAQALNPNDWWVLLRPGKRVRPGTHLHFLDRAGQPSPLEATVIEKSEDGLYRLQFFGLPDLTSALEALGEVPLPPYITRPPGTGGIDDRARYQTVYARDDGSVAAPTAGLHFTPTLLETLRSRGLDICSVTLHVGLGTFAPVKATDLDRHLMHDEPFELGADTALRISAARAAGRRIVAVGTTTTRVLEHVAAQQDGALTPTRGRTRLFIRPPFRFRVVDALITNFHLPCSTLLMLVSAFAAPDDLRGRELVLTAYREAVAAQYRFYSYGDAMLIL